MPEELNLDCEALATFKRCMNIYLKDMIRKMYAKGMTEGTLTGKVKIILEQGADENGEIINMLTIKPDVKAKISMENKAEMEKQEGIFMKFDENGHPIVANQQINMEDYMQRGA